MNKPYRVAVIGRTGKGAYGHGLDVVWKAVPNVELVAVADEDDRGRAAAVERLHPHRAYADYRQMLERERPQIVSVADRWLDAHREMVLACAHVGANVFLEKPLCRTLAEADEMVAASERHHIKVAIAHQTRYSPRVHQVRALIQQGLLGDVLELRARGKEDSRGGGQDLMVLGTHLFDLMRFLAGDARRCFSRIWQDGKPVLRGDVRQGGEGMGPAAGDRIAAMYEFDRGVQGFFASHRAQHGMGQRYGLQIFGSKGVIQLTPGALPPVYFLGDPSWFPGQSKASRQPITSQGLGHPERLTDGGLAQGNVWIVKDLIEAIEQDRQPLSSIYDGRAALEMILAVYESHRLQRAVELPLANRRHPLTML